VFYYYIQVIVYRVFMQLTFILLDVLVN